MRIEPEHLGAVPPAGAIDAGGRGGHAVLQQHAQHRRLPAARRVSALGGRCSHDAPGNAVDGRVNQIRVAQLAERTGFVGDDIIVNQIAVVSRISGWGRQAAAGASHLVVIVLAGHRKDPSGCRVRRALSNLHDWKKRSRTVTSKKIKSRKPTTQCTPSMNNS